jgi:hypothetical protein
MTGLVVDAAGWAGAAALLLAYGLVSSRKVDGGGMRFQLLNLGGALGLAANGVYHGAWPSAALNVVWIGIGLVALRRLRDRRSTAA